MSFGKRLQEARKKKGLSQEDVAKHLNTKAPVIGRYEREEMKPSIDVVTKIADLLEVSLDYLVGKTDVELDDVMLKRIQLVSKLPDKEKEHVFVFLDSFIDRMKLQGVL